jgi:hypothetical protein
MTAMPDHPADVLALSGTVTCRTQWVSPDTDCLTRLMTPLRGKRRSLGGIAAPGELKIEVTRRTTPGANTRSDSPPGYR